MKTFSEKKKRSTSSKVYILSVPFIAVSLAMGIVQAVECLSVGIDNWLTYTIITLVFGFVAVVIMCIASLIERKEDNMRYLSGSRRHLNK